MDTEFRVGRFHLEEAADMINITGGQINGDFNGSVTVRNVDALKANLARVQKNAKKAILDAVGTAAAKIHTRTVDLCPKDTFFMSEHVRTDFSPGGYTFTTGWQATDFIGTTDATGKPRSFYPFFVEFGTRRMRARPSLSIAYAEELPRFQRSLAAAMRNAYER